MRLLIYGGCHATALKRILDKYSMTKVAVDTLINFRLIARNEAFPYHLLDQYDFILFNPILNRQEHNTSHIEDYCKTRGIRYLKYPWLQWGGYWPAPKKRTWGGDSEWGLSFLLEHVKQYTGRGDALGEKSSFDSYYESLFHEAHFRDFMEKEVELTTRQLRARELQGGVDFRISDYIHDNFRRKQLFLTPDHPSTELYKFVVGNVASALGIDVDPSFETSNIEIQEGIRTPILPGVAKALKLEFQASDWCNDEVLGSACYSLRDYAQTTFPSFPVRLATAMHATRIKTPDLAVVSTVKQRSRLLVNLRDQPGMKDHLTVEMLGVSSERDLGVLLYKPHWRMAAPSF